MEEFTSTRKTGCSDSVPMLSPSGRSGADEPKSFRIGRVPLKSHKYYSRALVAS
jgi:hypothetical protein